MRIRANVPIGAPLDVAWARLSDIASHVEWMADAASIEFTSATTRGVGTTFDCVTKIGPFTTVDKMTIVEWVERRVIGVRHAGTVVGTGRFALAATSEGCELVWTEDLRMPRRLGGGVAGWAARPVLSHIWKGNLHRFARLCESDYHK